MPPTIGVEEVRRHNGPKSCWMVIHNDVYDVTKFLDSHPGGASALLDFAGKDGTLAFESVGHSESARSMMTKYKIGLLPLTQHSSHYKSCMRKSTSVSAPAPAQREDSKIIDHRVEFMVYTVNTGRTPKSSKSPKSPLSPKSKSGYSTPKGSTPRIEPRVKSIVVPRERRSRGFPCEPSSRSRPRPAPAAEGSSGWKWALLALGAAIIVGIALKKYM